MVESCWLSCLAVCTTRDVWTWCGERSGGRRCVLTMSAIAASAAMELITIMGRRRQRQTLRDVIDYVWTKLVDTGGMQPACLWRRHLIKPLCCRTDRSQQYVRSPREVTTETATVVALLRGTFKKFVAGRRWDALNIDEYNLSIQTRANNRFIIVFSVVSVTDVGVL